MRGPTAVSAESRRTKPTLTRVAGFRAMTVPRPRGASIFRRVHAVGRITRGPGPTSRMVATSRADTRVVTRPDDLDAGGPSRPTPPPSPSGCRRARPGGRPDRRRRGAGRRLAPRSDLRVVRRGRVRVAVRGCDRAVRGGPPPFLAGPDAPRCGRRSARGDARRLPSSSRPWRLRPLSSRGGTGRSRASLRPHPERHPDPRGAGRRSARAGAGTAVDAVESAGAAADRAGDRGPPAGQGPCAEDGLRP